MASSDTKSGLTDTRQTRADGNQQFGGLEAGLDALENVTLLGEISGGLPAFGGCACEVGGIGTFA